jgi:hypothetical protein
MLSAEVYLMGYTPLFSSIATGTLCGKWPDIGMWAFILSQADPRGILDVTPDYLARVTGLPMTEVVACMERFCSPDPYSRTATAGGARLELIDPQNRQWGWRVINHGQYREKARLIAKDSERTASGRDAERKRAARLSGHGQSVPRSPPDSPGVPLSDSDKTQTQDNPPVSPRRAGGSETTDVKPSRNSGTRLPDDFALTADRRRVAEDEHVDPERTFAKFCDHWRAASGANSRKRDWEAAWRNWCRAEADRASPGGSRRVEPLPTGKDRQRAIAEAWERQKGRARQIGFRMPLQNEALDNYREKINERISELEADRRRGGPVSVAALLQKGNGS